MADGSQLRRRVRMATADEPIDADSIANQAAGELRQQIEASPIPDRLARVVEEDRPLASRVASAETPLVPEPDDSPSAREVSFRLPEPTGRVAVRSALRTPGLSADLRPRSPFGEDETGIAPEPEAAAKPEMADTDILEPEQPDQPGRSPAGPDRDATAQSVATDELADLHKAQRRDRRMAIAGGVLRGVQALAGMIGTAANIPGLAGLGGMAGVASGVIPQGRATEQFGQEHALRKEAAQAQQRAEQTAYERAQDADQAKRAERQLAVNVSNAEAGQVNARASREMQNRLNETRLAEYAAENDPAHPDAENARGVFSSFLDAAAREKPELREDFADIVERLPNMSASQIRGAIDQLKIFRNAPAGARRTRGGRGPGGPARPSGAEVTPEQRAAYERLVNRYAGITGDDPDTIRVAFNDIAFALNPDEPRSLISRVGSGGSQDVNAQQTQAARIAAMSTPGTPEFESAIRQYGEDIRKPRGRYLNLGTIITEMNRLNQAQQIAALRSDSAAAAAGATAARSAIWAALNSYFHENGGANIVDSEMSRYMSAFGAGSITAPPSSFLQAIQRDANRARGDMDHEAARFPDAVREEFRRRNQRGRR